LKRMLKRTLDPSAGTEGYNFAIGISSTI